MRQQILFVLLENEQTPKRIKEIKMNLKMVNIRTSFIVNEVNRHLKSDDINYL